MVTAAKRSSSGIVGTTGITVIAVRALCHGIKRLSIITAEEPF
jgi:hypothetical protein